jgi:hypothetical protein
MGSQNDGCKRTNKRNNRIESTCTSNFSEILVQIDNEITDEQLEKLKCLCTDLQGGTNPVGLDRGVLEEADHAFKLFVLLHDQHCDAFPGNIATLLRCLHSNRCDMLASMLVTSWKTIITRGRFVINILTHAP